jgi:hypothetical protein
VACTGAARPTAIAHTAATATVYFAPTIIALVRKSRDLGVVAVINMFLGWTLVGWVVALAFAMRDNSTRNQQPYPYPYGDPAQQGWPAQPPMHWPREAVTPPYGNPSTPA